MKLVHILIERRRGDNQKGLPKIVKNGDKRFKPTRYRLKIKKKTILIAVIFRGYQMQATYFFRIPESIIISELVTQGTSSRVYRFGVVLSGYNLETTGK